MVPTDAIEMAGLAFAPVADSAWAVLSAPGQGLPDDTLHVRTSSVLITVTGDDGTVIVGRMTREQIHDLFHKTREYIDDA